MSQHQVQEITFGSSTSHSTPIGARIPTEILREIFKVYAASNPKLLDRRVVDLCLVGKFWNEAARDTPELWTKINLSFPFTHDHLAAATKRVDESKTEKIDVSIDFRDPEWDAKVVELREGANIPATNAVSGWVEEIMGVLNGTESRWKSIRVVSDTWLPLHRLMEAWTSKNPVSLESISMTRTSAVFGQADVDLCPEKFVGPMTIFNQQIPMLRDLSLSGIHVGWNDIYGRVHNLRKLVIKNQTHGVEPTFQEFADMLSSSPRLKCLDISGFCPRHHSGPLPPHVRKPRTPIIPLPALKEFTFGWRGTSHGCALLDMFQIGNTLKSLTLVDTRSMLDIWTGGQGWDQSSEMTFEVLRRLGKNAPRDGGKIPPRAFICMRGVKRLEIVRMRCREVGMEKFLGMMTGLEEIRLEGDDGHILTTIASVYVKRKREDRMKRVKIGWMWRVGIPMVVKRSMLNLEKAGVKVRWSEVVRSQW